MDLPSELRELSLRHLDGLGAIPWAAEADRWAELVFCLLNAVAGDDPERSRELTDDLHRFGLIEPAVLLDVDDPASDTHRVVRHLLDRYGFDQAQIVTAAGVLSRLAQFITDGYGGKLQRYLRRNAERMRDELVSELADEAPQPLLRLAVTHWLQNAVDLPLSLENAAVQEFCAARGIDQAALELAADEVGLNLALVDDVIRLEAADPVKTGAVVSEATT
ncbi:hypothetical protein GCM10009541_54380 [Micromonospora gifhornensis]|uniref:Uncharacterized protein n=1 Tax=Micromonospora gifhornensis TaxID=84594 RepID=A0ABQ4INP9_9ACTN|nr:hypothetical protein [Micromonospora gifhornensis]GIJ19338.1 hypothetical protein Vgi01_60220 [Micromonospora gifhornensis]